MKELQLFIVAHLCAYKDKVEEGGGVFVYD